MGSPSMVTARSVRSGVKVSVITTLSSAAVGGKTEGEGPHGDRFDYIDPEGKFGKETWE